MAAGDEPYTTSKLQGAWEAFNERFGIYRYGPEVQGTMVRLKFESRDYSLRDLQHRLTGLTSLIILAGDAGFHLGEAVELSQNDADAERFRTLRHRSSKERTAVANLVDVEEVSLNSPLELLVWIPLAGAGIAMLRKLLAARNEWNDTRAKKSDTDLRIAENATAKYKEELKLKILQSLAEESHVINPERVMAVSIGHPSRGLLSQSVDLLEELEVLEVGPEVTKTKKRKK